MLIAGGDFKPALTKKLRCWYIYMIKDLFQV